MSQTIELPFSNDQISSCIEVLSQFLSSPKLKYLAQSDSNVKELMRVTNSLGSNSRNDRKKARKLAELEAPVPVPSSTLSPWEVNLRLCQNASSSQFSTSSMEESDTKRQRLANDILPVKPEKNIVNIVDTSKNASTGTTYSSIDSDYKSTTHQYTNSKSHCYVCHKAFTAKHVYYKYLCQPCGDYNYTKRDITCTLTDKIALVTGCRIKIGFEVCLSLLRCGATVHGITRFPKDAAVRYSQQPDYKTWKHRLFIYALDLRDISAVHYFCHYFKNTVTDKLHILINNAAQTVRKPPAFYHHLLAVEQAILPVNVATSTVVPDTLYLPQRSSALITGGGNVVPLFSGALIAGTADINAIPQNKLLLNIDNIAEKTEQTMSVSTQLVNISQSATKDTTMTTATNTATANAGNALTSLAQSAAMAMMPLAPGDRVHNPSEFPPGVYDEDGQQVDMRQTNSWIQKAGEISTVEVLEVQTINSTAPYIFCSELKAIMAQTKGNKFIINVSAMEGQFYRFKTACHPHTNMAKAALNMFTRTSAGQFAMEGDIYMNAVDTGWVTDERPLPLRSVPVTSTSTGTSTKGDKRQPKNNTNEVPSVFECPIDCIDGAMRVLDPIYMAVLAEEDQLKVSGTTKAVKPCYGLFLKDYFPTRW